MINIKHQDLHIDKDKPFANCKLEREKYANVLTSIVSTYADGFVLAINNEWGTGKTTFVKMWQQQLKNRELETLYFNAWENDFDCNPLVAIMAELKTLVTKKNKAAFNSALKKGAVVVKNVLPAILKGVLKKYIDIDELTDGVENAAKAGVEILEDEIKEYADKKQSLRDFREQLKKFIEQTSDKKPIVFIIDELDRCKPNYAVEVLEQVKHFFSVTGIVFALSIDKIQLGHAVRGVYGSDLINAEDYLRRFIDLEYCIPTPDTKQSTDYFFEYYQFDDFLSSTERMAIREIQKDKSYFLKMAAFIFQHNNVSLRQQEKIFSHARIALSSFNKNSYLFPEAFLYLSFIKTLKFDFYSQLRSKSLSLEELAKEYYKTVPHLIDKYDEKGILALEALLVVMYDRLKYPHGNSPYKTTDEQGEATLNVDSIFDPSEYNLQYRAAIKRVIIRTNSIALSHVLDRIDLTENIVS